MRQFALFLLVGVITVSAQLAMKQGVRGVSISSVADLLSPSLWLRPWLLSSLVLYALSAALYIVLLSKMDVGRLYPAFLGFCIALVYAGSALFGLEKISLVKTGGVALIGLGILILHMRS